MIQNVCEDLDTSEPAEPDIDQQLRDLDQGLEARYRFEPTARFFYEDLFAPLQQQPSLVDIVLARLTRRSLTPVSSRSRNISGTTVGR